ncbi:hypothetical protein CLV40_1045 [Actinokineospora auranticolor]|uniref:Uncharacterized protein n=1 Tax=Actinokineospora auranticolor TaxID=155976 RepID=A0A2S6GU40_9PSEU|nr:hypothetical protein CLV40_1045 [Actinokineospora auranticolor]
MKGPGVPRPFFHRSPSSSPTRAAHHHTTPLRRPSPPRPDPLSAGYPHPRRPSTGFRAPFPTTPAPIDWSRAVPPEEGGGRPGSGRGVEIATDQAIPGQAEPAAHRPSRTRPHRTATPANRLHPTKVNPLPADVCQPDPAQLFALPRTARWAWVVFAWGTSPPKLPCGWGGSPIPTALAPPQARRGPAQRQFTPSSAARHSRPDHERTAPRRVGTSPCGTSGEPLPRHRPNHPERENRSPTDPGLSRRRRSPTPQPPTTPPSTPPPAPSADTR